MGRTRGFDPSVVLEAAADTFVQRGYEGTSIDDLVRATGVHRGSLYGTFGSKRGIFVAALDRATHGPADAVDLLLVALLELAPRDPEVRRIATAAVHSSFPVDPEHALGARLLARAEGSDHI